MNRLHKHLELIQDVINRMASNSFQLRGWSVLLVSALFALAATNSNFTFILLAYFPAIAFWILDSYYLWQERLYRALYDHVRTLTDDQIDYSMDTRLFKKDVDPWAKICFSVTIRMFHGAIIGTIIIVMFFSV